MIKKLDEFQILFLISCPLFFMLGPFLSNLFVVLFSMTFLLTIYLKKNFKIFKSNIYLLFFIFNIFIIIRSLLSNTPLFSLEASIFYFRFLIFAIAVGYYISLYPQIRKYFLYVSIFCLFFLLIDSIFQFYFKFNLFLMPLHPQRVSSIFGEELIMGGYVLKLLPLIILCIFSIKLSNNLEMFSTFLILMISLVLILLSGERTALFLYITFFILLFFCLKKSMTRLMFLLIVLVATIFSVFNKPVFDRMYSRTYDQIFGDNEKIYIFSPQHHAHYLNSAKIFFQNPILGIGPKNFRIQCNYEKYKVDIITSNNELINGCQTHPHNIYLQLLAETGIVGFLFLISFFIYISYKMIREFKINYLRSESLNSPMFLSMAAIILNIFPIAPTSNFFGSSFNFMLYLSIGFYFSYFYIFENNEK